MKEKKGGRKPKELNPIPPKTYEEWKNMKKGKWKPEICGPWLFNPPFNLYETNGDEYL